jgi:membrane protease YdiL (CAAX protease family)
MLPRTPLTGGNSEPNVPGEFLPARLSRVRRSGSVARIALFMIACAVVLAGVAPLSRKIPGQWSLAVIGASTSLAAFAMSALFARWDRVRLHEIGAAIGSRSLPRLGLGFLVGLLLAAIQAAAMFLTGHVRYSLSPNAGFRTAFVTLVGYLLLSCREELAFHGYPLRRLDSLFGLYPAQLVIALLFAGEHVLGGDSWANALVGAATGSLLFGMAALATRGLAVPIGLHAAWNFGQWVLGEKETPGLWTAMTDQSFRASVERTGMISYVMLMGTATYIFWLRYRRQMPVGS